MTPGPELPKTEGWFPIDLPISSMGGRIDLIVRSQDRHVTGAQVSVGHLHRGVEGACEERTYVGVMPLAARTAVRSSIHWQVAFAEAVEVLSGLVVPPRATSIRVALMELERIADHMLAYATILDLAGCRAAASSVWADRELVIDTVQSVTGQRLVHDAICVGGVTCDTDPEWSRRASLLSRTVQAAVHSYVQEAEMLTPLTRLDNLAPVHIEDMRGYGLSGPLLRAAGVPKDARADGRSRPYREIDVPIITRDAGDAMARTEVRLLEIAASAKVLDHVARTMPGGRIRTARPGMVTKGSAIGLVEDPRGELLCYVVSDGSERPRRVRWRSPDAAHGAVLEELLIGCPVDDVGLALASVDLCTGGIDR